MPHRRKQQKTEKAEKTEKTAKNLRKNEGFLLRPGVREPFR
jgi:hypothetical protein